MFCPNCGASVEGRFCAKCGTAVDVATASASAGPPPGAHAYGAPAATAGGLSQNVAAALAYVLGLITGILFLVLAPYSQNRFVRFHAFQSILLNAAWIGVWIVEFFLMTMLPWYLTSIITMLIALAFLAAWVVCLVKAYSGERFKLPVIGDIAEKQA